MSQVEIPYDEALEEIVEAIEERHLKILATSSDYVSAREVRFISDGLTMFFFTDSQSRKYQQIVANPKVGVAVGNLQIEGEAVIKGSPRDEGAQKYFDIFKRKQPDWYQRWKDEGNFDFPNLRVIEVVPNRISMYKTRAFDNVPESYYLLLNIEKHKAYKMSYEKLFESPAYKS